MSTEELTSLESTVQAGEYPLIHVTWVRVLVTSTLVCYPKLVPPKQQTSVSEFTFFRKQKTWVPQPSVYVMESADKVLDHNHMKSDHWQNQAGLTQQQKESRGRNLFL